MKGNPAIMKRTRRIMLAGMLLLLVLGSSGCGSSHKSPEGVVRALVKSYGEGNEKKIRDCYGEKEDGEGGADLSKEIEATVQYYQAHNIKKISIKECKVLSSEKDLAYVCAVYDLVLEDKQEYPCVSTYMVKKNENQKYYVLPSSEISRDMGKKAAQEYADFMKTDSYKDYSKEYEKFIKRNPGYEQRIADRIG